MVRKVRDKVTIIMPTEMESNRDLRKLSVEQIKKFTKNVNYDLKIVQFEESFSKTVNRAIKNSDPESDVILINDDVFVRPGWVEAFKKLISEDVGIVGVKLRYPNSKIIQHAGIHFMHNCIPLHVGQLTIDSGIYNQVETVPAVTFACVYIRREVIEKVGLLDEDYKVAYFEDVDYCLRVLKSGFKIKVNNNFYNFHAESVTAKKIPNKDEIFKSNMERFLKKWRGYIETITL